MKLWILIGLGLPLLAQVQQPASQSFVIKGSVKETGPLNQRIYLRYEQNGVQRLDSAAITNNNYRFSGVLNYPVKATLFFAVPDSTARYFQQTHLIKPYECPFYLDAGQLDIEADTLLVASRVTGSAAQTDYELLEQQLKVVYDKENTLYSEVGKPAYEKNDSVAMARYLEKAYRLDDETVALRWGFMDKHPTSGIVLDLLQECTRSFLDPVVAAPVLSHMSAALQSSPAGKAYARRLEKAKLTAAGALAPDFVLNNNISRLTRLSDFKGKLVLLDFWGSWCGPCRMSNPHLKQMYTAYKPQGFEIVAVSCERSGTLQQQQDKWKKALKEDGMNWVNLLNNDGPHAEDVAKLYGVTAFPTKLLIDRKGKVIRRFVGNTPLKQEELEQLVKEHLAASQN